MEDNSDQTGVLGPRGAPVTTRLVRYQAGHRALLSRLIELYCYDFSGYEGTDVDDEGRFGDAVTEGWLDPQRDTYLIQADGHWAGFVLVLETCRFVTAPGAHSVGEFFILQRYRRHGVGAAAARAVFGLYPGPWEVLQLANNHRAQAFWRRVVGDLGVGFADLDTHDPRWVGLSFVTP